MELDRIVRTSTGLREGIGRHDSLNRTICRVLRLFRSCLYSKR